MTESVPKSSTAILSDLIMTRPTKVLHVDDDPDFLKVAEQCLKRQGRFQVDTARSAEEAMEMMEKETYDAIVSDYQMPGKDGLAFLRELRQKGNTIPFIMFTGKGREEIAINALNFGADQYLNKVGDPETVYCELAYSIQKTVQRNEVREMLKESEEKFRRIVENTQDVIMLTRSDGIISYISPSCMSVLGYSPRDLGGKQPWIIHPNDLERVKNLHYRALKGERGSDVEYRIFTKNGETKWISHSWSPIVENGEVKLIVSVIRDSNERKKAEEALSAERDKLETVTRNVGAGLAIISKDYRTLWANDVLKQIFGDVEGKICYSTYNHRNDICPECGVQEIFETGKAKVVHEQVGKDVDGKTIWSEITATPVKDRDRNIIAVLELVVPITQRKRTEEELHDSAEKYRKLFDEALDAIFVADAETGTLIDCNRAASELVGREKSELIGKHQRILHPPEKTEEEFSTTFKQHLKEKEGQTLETQLITKKGEIKDVAVKANVFELGNKRVVQGIFRDITEHAWASSFPERNPNPILEVDLDGNTNYLNPAGHKLLSKLRGLKLSNAFEKELKTLVDEFKIHRKENFARENVKIGDRYYQQSIYYFSEKSVLRLYMIDVTERKETEEQVKKVRKEFLRIFDAISDFVFIINMDYRLVRVNKKVCEVLKKEPEQLVGKRCYEVMHGTDKPWPNCPYRKTLETKEASSAEIDDPNIGMPLLVTTSPIFDEEGEFVQCVHTAKDITERKEAKEKLRYWKEFNERVVDSIGDPLLIIDPSDHAIISANEAALKQLESRKEDLIGKTCYEATHHRSTPCKPPHDVCPIQELLKTGEPVTVEHQHFVGDNNMISVEVTVHPVKDKEGKTVQVVHIVKDITERIQADKKLRESEEKLRNTIESSPDAITITDLRGIIVDCNQAAVSLGGFSSKEELMGKNAFTLIAEEDHRRAMENYKITAEKGFLRNVPYTLVKKDGHEYPAELSASVLKDGSGNPVGFVAVIRDITERKKMQRELEKYSQQLEDMVEHRTKQLKDTQEQLVKAERLATIGQIAAMVGHDLRNPLTSISIAAHYLKTKLGAKAEEKMTEMLEVIEEDVQYSNRIITDLMDYSREIKLELTETTPKSIIAESVFLIQIPERVQLEDSTLNEPRIRIDIDKMKRVFANFIKNAFDAMPQGGKLTISSRAAGGDVEFMLNDTGVGMAKEVSEKIWTPFFTTKAKGMGLGLAICRRIIEAHQGKISVDSIVGEGTTFTVTIPLEPKPRAEGGEKAWVNVPESLLSTTTKA